MSRSENNEIPKSVINLHYTGSPKGNIEWELIQGDFSAKIH